MLDNNSFINTLLYPLLASAAGAITALSFRSFQDMRLIEIALALFVGASFAFFIGPWVTHMIFGNGPIDLKLQGAVYYILASGSNLIIPRVIHKAATVIDMWGPPHDKDKPV